MEKQSSFKFVIQYNLLLSIFASTAISAAILIKYGQFSWGQLAVDTIQAIIISVLVGVGFPFDLITKPLKSTLSLSGWPLRLATNAMICAIVAAVVTIYFKLLIFGFGPATGPAFLADYPLSWAVGVSVAFILEPYLLSFLQADR